jgi:hypothetical protein
VGVKNNEISGCMQCSAVSFRVEWGERVGGVSGRREGEWEERERE